MNNYIYNIFIIIFITSIILLLIPKNKFEKLIKSILGIIVILSILSSIIKFDMDDLIFNNSYSTDAYYELPNSSYFDYILEKKNKIVSQNIKNHLEVNCECDIKDYVDKIDEIVVFSEYDDKNTYQINSVEIYFENVVILDMDKNIIISDEVKKSLINSYYLSNSFIVNINKKVVK